MTVEIKYFGMLAEQIGRSEEVRTVSGQSVSEIKQDLENTYWPLQSMPYRIAVNQALANEDHMVKEGDTLAFLPPFAGG